MIIIVVEIGKVCTFMFKEIQMAIVISFKLDGSIINVLSFVNRFII